MINESKAQMGMFVVIATILVLILVIVVGFNFDKIEVFNEDRSSFKIKEFVEVCMENTLDEGIEQIGKHGGWLYHPPLTFTNRNSVNILNKRAQGLDFLEKLEIPYWYYYDDNTEEFVLNVPPYDTDNIYSIRNQIKTYVDENLEGCLNNFEAYEGIYNVEYDINQIDTIVTLRNDEVEARANLPILITDETTGAVESVENFNVDMENKLFVPYLLARDIALAQSQSHFVERRILQFLTPYQSSSSRDLLPPTYDFELTYDFRPWRVSDVEEQVKRIMSSSISEIQFLNTDYERASLEPELRDNDFARSFVDIYTKDYLSEHSIVKEDNPRLFREYKDYKVSPSYHIFFPMYFGLDPSIGNAIVLPEPQAILNFLPIFYTEYVTVYEITAPILFEIDSNENDEFVFNLVIEANIDHNAPLAENYEFDFNLESLGSDESAKSLICDPPQMISEFVSINLTDPINFGEREVGDGSAAVDEAIVSFSCKDLVTCYIGETEKNSEYNGNEYSNMRFRLPIDCDPGSLEIYKFGHQKIVIDGLDPKLDEPIDLGIVELASSKNMKVNFGVKDSGSGRYSVGRAVTESENGFVVFTNLETEEFVSVLEFNSTNQYELDMDLLPGNYSIQGFLTYDEEIIIPAEEVCYETGLFGDEECETLPEINLSAWISAGIGIEEFEITTKELLNRDTININFVEYGVPRTYDELQRVSTNIGNIEETSLNQAPTFD